MIVRFDLATGKEALLDWGKNAQVDGYCSPDRKQLVWVDYRDPPGELSELSVTAGEIYLRDLEAGTTRRLTYDSPAAPRRKFAPSVGDKYVFWKEEPEPALEEVHPRNFPAIATVLVRYELATGRKCRLPSDRNSSRTSYGAKLLRYYMNPDSPADVYLVLWDSEHPSRQWVCEG